MKRTRKGNALKSGTKRMVGLLLVVGLVSSATAAEVNVATALVNSGFEQGTEPWKLTIAPDYAQVAVVDDLSAPDGRMVLLFDHQRTRNSSVSQTCTLKPYSLYLLSFWVKTENYHRTGTGFRVIATADGVEASDRYSESQLSEPWQLKRLAFTTGAQGQASVTFALSTAAGRVFVDNVQITETTRDQARAVIGSCPMIPQLSLKPQQAHARIQYDEIPLSDRLVSQITFQVAENLGADLWTKTGRLQVELPAEITLYQSSAAQEDLGNGYRRYTFPAAAFYPAYGDYYLYVFLNPSTPNVQGRQVKFWAQWQDGAQSPLTINCTYIQVPKVAQPKTLVTGTTSYFQTPEGYPEYFAMLQSLGFNTIDSWHAGNDFLEEFRNHGMEVDVEYSGLGELEKRLEAIPEAQAVGFDGKPRPSVLEPAYRGELFDAWLADHDRLASQGYSYIMYDDEHYRDWASMDTGLNDLAKERWVQWLAQRRPGLSPVMPEVFLDDPLNHLEQYQAWWMFRASLVTEWYAAAREQFQKSVQKYGAKSSNEFLVASYTGPSEFSYIKSSYTNPVELAGIWDRIAPMYYETSYDLRHFMQNLVRAVGREHAYGTLCMGEARANRWVWRPGEVRAQMLEVLFAGGMGYIYWSWPYSNLRIIAEVAQTNGIVADHEDIFLSGQATNRFWTEQDRRFATTWETPQAGLLLVSNYTLTADQQVWLRKRPEPALTLTELYSGAVLHLAENQQIFSVKVPPENCLLFKWQK